MNTISAYFITFGVLLLLYVFIRFVIMTYMGTSFTGRTRYTFKDYIKGMRGFKCGPIQFDGKSIQTTELSHRIQHVREELAQGKTPQRPASFKRAIAVENKRAEMAKLPFFQSQPPPPSDSQEHEDGLHLLLV